MENDGKKDAIGNIIDPEVYITHHRKNNRWKYVYTSGKQYGQCLICLQPVKESSKELEAHHIIPKRMRYRLKNPPLTELRMKICKKCHDELHVENELITMLVKLINLVDSKGFDEKTNEITQVVGLIKEKFQTYAKLVNIMGGRTMYEVVENTIGHPDKTPKIVFKNVEDLKKARQQIDDGKDLFVKKEGEITLLVAKDLTNLVYEGKVVLAAKEDVPGKK